MIVRDERVEDEAFIAALTKAAFRSAPHTDGTEHLLPGRLRAAGQLTVSLVADDDGQLVGHVALSPVTISDGSPDWFGLAPVSIEPQRQGEGIGSALIHEGLARLRRLGAHGCVVLGEPAYYGRFGFVHDPALTFPGPPPEYFQRIVLEGPAATGTVTYAPAFS